MSRLRWPLRLYIAAVMAAASVALLLGAFLPRRAGATELVLFLVVVGMATVARLWPVHLSVKVKITVEDTATFAGALLLGPLLAMAATALSSLVAQRLRRTRTRWYNRGFNAAASTLSIGAAAFVYLALAGDSGPVVTQPFPILASAATKYLVQSTLVDLVVALQLRRNPLARWWGLHRRLVVHESALLLLGALAAISADQHPWTLVLFGVPMAVTLFTVRESAAVRRQTRDAILELADLIDLRDPYTHGHSQRVAALAERLARRMKLEPRQVELIRDAARVHDIGKIGTNDRVLLKPGPLTSEEQSEMRQHAAIGHRLLRRLPEFWEGAELVLAHHERHDGAGYPRGISGDELPVEVSVISVVDTYDAMTSDRPYRKGLDWPDVRSELVRQRGKQWREHAVDAFLEMMDEQHGVAASSQWAGSSSAA